MGAYGNFVRKVMPLQKKPAAPTPPPIQQTGPGNPAPQPPGISTGMPTLSPTPTAPTQYGAVGQSQITPANSLIGQQLTPGMSQDTANARGAIGQSLGALQGPDRGALAGQTFQQLRDLSQPQFEQDLRSVGQNAAKFGRIGAGMTTNALGDVAGNREKYLGTLQQQLATESAGQTLQDRLGVLGGQQAGLGQLSGLDQQQYGNMFGERGYQQGLAQQGFQNDQQINGLLAQLGFGGNEGALQQLIGQQYGNQAQNASQGAGDILKLLMQQPGQRRPGAPGISAPAPQGA